VCALTHAAVHHYGWVNGSFSCALWLFIEWIMAFDCVNCGSLLCGSWLFIVWIMALLMCVRYYSNTATRSDTLQQTTMHCTTLQHTVTHGIAMQCTATHCNTLQHTATHHTGVQHRGCGALANLASNANRTKFIPLKVIMCDAEHTTYFSRKLAATHCNTILLQGHYVWRGASIYAK